MPVNSLYFVPWSSINETIGTINFLGITISAGTINTGLDTGNLGAVIAGNSSISLSGPTSVIEVDDTGSTPNEFTDDGQFGSQTLASAFAGNAVGSGVEPLYSYTLSGSDGSTVTIYGVAIGGTATDDVLDGFVASAQLTPGVTYTVTALDSTIDPRYDSLATCFTPGSLIDTASGAQPVEKLRVGDRIKTADHGYQNIRWIGSQTIVFDGSETTEKQRPICIRANALGPNHPMHDLVVSPQHRILVRSKIAKRMFDTEEVLVAAKHLSSIDGIAEDTNVTHVQYIHFLFDNHEIVWANGVETESLLTGPEALKAIGAAAFQKIMELFPERCVPGYKPQSARKIVSGKLGRKLAWRHNKNAMPLVAARDAFTLGKIETEQLLNSNWS